MQELLEQAGPIDEQLAERVLLQLCEALELLHTHNIIHRDLKPSNIMLTDADNIVLLDFDAARDITSLGERDTMVLGTPGYAPPEQYGFAATDTRSDFYALGKTMQELLGHEYHGRLSKIIDKCTEFDPKHRVSSAAEIKSLLRRGRRQKWLAAAAAFAVICGGTAYWLLDYDNAATPAIKNSKRTEQQKNLPSKGQKQDSLPSEQAAQPSGQAGTSEAEQSKTQEQKKFVIEQTEAQKESAPAAEQPEAKPEVKNVGQPAKVQLQSLNWDKFYKAEARALRDNVVSEIEKQGFTYVKHQNGSWPKQIIINNSDAELINPIVQLYFTDFAVCGENFAAESWGGRTEITEYADAIYRTEYGKGVYQSVTLRLTGTVPAHDYAELGLFGGVNGYFITGSQPQVKVIMNADNAAAITQEYAIQF